MAFVHMGDGGQGGALFAKYGLGDVPAFSDPAAELYRAFGLRRVPWAHFLRWGNLRRAIASLRAGHTLGRPVGDVQRMPGVFLLDKGEVVRAFRHAAAHERPDYLAQAGCPVGPPAGPALGSAGRRA